MLCFGCRFVFFFLSFRALLFVLGAIKRWSSLSLFSLPGEIGNHIIQSLSLSLSLSYEARAFWKTRSPSRMLRRTQKERGMIISEKEDKLARESRKKKDGLDFSSHRAEQQPQRVVASKTKTHTRTNLCVTCYLPSAAPAGHASKIHSPSVALIYIYMYTYILYQISLTNAFVLSTRCCCVRIRTKTRGRKTCDD